MFDIDLNGESYIDSYENDYECFDGESYGDYALLPKVFNYSFYSEKAYKIWGEIDGVEFECFYPKSLTMRAKSGIMVKPYLLKKNIENSLKDQTI